MRHTLTDNERRLLHYLQAQDPDGCTGVDIDNALDLLDLTWGELGQADRKGLVTQAGGRLYITVTGAKVGNDL